MLTICFLVFYQFAQVIWNFITDPTIGPHSRIKRKFHQDKLKKKSK